MKQGHDFDQRIVIVGQQASFILDMMCQIMSSFKYIKHALTGHFIWYTYSAAGTNI